MIIINHVYFLGFGASLQCTKPHAGGEEAVRFIEEGNVNVLKITYTVPNSSQEQLQKSLTIGPLPDVPP